jgi:hypothetical protein
VLCSSQNNDAPFKVHLKTNNEIESDFDKAVKKLSPPTTTSKKKNNVMTIHYRALCNSGWQQGQADDFNKVAFDIKSVLQFIRHYRNINVK